MNLSAPQLPPPHAVYSAVGRVRFENLFRIGRQTVAALPWEGRLQELSLEPDRVARAVASPADPPDAWRWVFEPFIGNWVGGDLHDASRAYRHIWHPASLEGDLLSQPVMMLSEEDPGDRIMAYNFARLTAEQLELTGVVGRRAHAGFFLEEGALLWFGEEPDGWISAHAERVWARGQLYDIRGVVFRLGPDGVQEALPSDWRYHRVAPGAIEVPE